MKKKFVLLVLIFLIKSESGLTLSKPDYIENELTKDSSKIYKLDQIYVQDKKVNKFDLPTSSQRRKISLEEELSSFNIGDLVSSQAGVFTLSYGSEGSLRTVSVRGSGSEYTSIFINGINYNNSVTGVFDFSKFSADEISEIHIKRGNDFDIYNQNSFGGVIVLNPFRNSDSTKYSLKLQTGSFGFSSFGFKSYGTILSSRYNFILSRKKARNNYEYDFNGDKESRKNSDVSQISTNLSLINQVKLFGKSLKINTFINLLSKDLGLPNFVSTNRHYNNLTRSQENFFNYSLNFNYVISERILINGILGYWNSRIDINDPLKSINLKTIKFSTVNEYNSQKFFVTVLFNPFHFSTGIIRNFEKIHIKEITAEETKLNDQTRTSYALNFLVNYEKEIFKKQLVFNLIFFNSLNHTVDNSLEKNIYRFFNKRIGFSLNTPDNKFTLYSNFGNGVRLPNYYEIFYSQLTSLSSNKIQNEKINSFEAGFRYNLTSIDFSQNPLIEITYFNLNIDNKIIWQPQRVAIFAPRNAGKINSQGVEITFENIKVSKNIFLNWNYSFTKSVKKSKAGLSDDSYNKQLPYIPIHKSSVTLLISINDFSAVTKSTYMSRRYFTEDNDILFSSNPIFIQDLSLNYKFKFSFTQLYTQIAVNNVFNKSYLIIQSFPMPGREYRLTINMEI